MLDSRYPHQVATYQVATQQPAHNGIILSHPARSQALHIDAAGAVIWTLCDGQRTVAEIAQILGEAYPESAQEIEQNVPETLLALTDFGAIEWT